MSEEPKLTDAEALFVNELEALEVAENTDPEAEAEAAEAEIQEAEKLEAEAEAQAAIAQVTAMTGLMGLEFALQQLIHPKFKFDSDAKTYALENMQPVLIKYGALLPQWLMQYEAEVKAIKAGGVLVKNAMSTRKQLIAEDKAAEAAKKALKANSDEAETEAETEAEKGGSNVQK